MARRSTQADRMNMPRAKHAISGFHSLYRSEAEIGRLVLGEHGEAWPELAAMWEREGLPKVDPMTGMRFWPAVDAFFQKKHGLIRQPVSAATDGVETWS
jgi:hypothetical protein